MSLKPTCREVHRLTSEGMDRELSLAERTRMRLHLLVCNACRNFTSQMSLIRQSMKQFVPIMPVVPIADALPDNDRKKDEP